MSVSKLPERASLEYLKKLAKDRLKDLRRSDPDARLAAAQLAVAREHGFPSWRALKAELDRRRAAAAAAFFAACAAGDVGRLTRLLEQDASLVRERNGAGSFGLHVAVRHPEALRVLLAHGADPNARDRGDNAYALHFAAGGGLLESARVLLDAGGDATGAGDLHEIDVIGWATVFRPKVAADVVELLVERGARHHVFSALAMADPDLVRQVVAEDAGALSRRLSRHEGGQTPLHFILAPPDGYQGRDLRPEQCAALRDLLIELDAGLDAKDDKGRTALDLAMLRGDADAMRRLHAAGAKAPPAPAEPPAGGDAELRAFGAHVLRCVPMIAAVDLRATVDWYVSIGFELGARHENEAGELDFAALSFGKAQIMLMPGEPDAEPGAKLWFFTDRLDELCRLLKLRQLRAANAALTGASAPVLEVRFENDLYDTFYGSREFSILDPNGVSLTFTDG